jgi:regulator of replication initiation timing
MTYSTIFDDAELPQELKRHKREISKLRKVIDSLETEITVKEYEIQKLKEQLKKK